MTLDTLLAFVVASTALLMVPGPTILMVVQTTVVHGRRSLVPLLSAVLLGDATALLCSLSGVGLLLATSAIAFTVLKIVGGLYLIWLGVRWLRTRVDARPPWAEEPSPPAAGLFGRVFLVATLNPKGIVFYAAFFPQFVDPAGPAVPQLVVLAVTFLVLALLNALVYAGFASRARAALESPRARTWLSRGGGTALCVAGGATLASDLPR